MSFQGLDKEGQPVKDKYYRLKVGGNVAEALRRGPLTREEATREGLVLSSSAKKEAEEAEEGH